MISDLHLSPIRTSKKMKNIFLAAAGSLLLLSLGACSEGQYWEQPGNLGEVYVFPKPAQTITVSLSDEMPTAIAVEVTRPEAGAAVDVTVLFATALSFKNTIRV